MGRLSLLRKDGCKVVSLFDIAALKVEGRADFHRSQTRGANDALCLETSPGVSETILVCRCLLGGLGCV